MSIDSLNIDPFSSTAPEWDASFVEALHIRPEHNVTFHLTLVRPENSAAGLEAIGNAAEQLLKRGYQTAAYIVSALKKNQAAELEEALKEGAQTEVRGRATLSAALLLNLFKEVAPEQNTAVLKALGLAVKQLADEDHLTVAEDVSMIKATIVDRFEQLQREEFYEADKREGGRLLRVREKEAQQTKLQEAKLPTFIPMPAWKRALGCRK